MTHSRFKKGSRLTLCGILALGLKIRRNWGTNCLACRTIILGIDPLPKGAEHSGITKLRAMKEVR